MVKDKIRKAENIEHISYDCEPSAKLMKALEFT